jgi:mRNA-degrading endonuclease RelE of RelBE toxin-antitoxin system
MMRVWVEPPAREEIKNLPGHIRQRIRRVVKALGSEPRPHHSRVLDAPEEILSSGLETRRIRLEKWRVIYVIDAEWDIVTVLAIRKRPPYDYSDLPELLTNV